MITPNTLNVLINNLLLLSILMKGLIYSESLLSNDLCVLREYLLFIVVKINHKEHEDQHEVHKAIILLIIRLETVTHF